MRPHGTPQQLEQRRHRAISMLRSGKPHRFVAQKLKASLSSVIRWQQMHRRKGRHGLRSNRWGRPSHLSERQKEKTLQLLVKGARAAGHATELWTLKRIAQLIEKHHGVRCSHAGVWKLLRTGFRWSSQKPERRAIQRNDKAIAFWKRHAWPRIKKARRLRAYLAFLDESGFLLIPNVRKTWAPMGQTPQLRHSYRRDKVSVIGSLAVSPRHQRLGLYLRFHLKKNITGLGGIAFLEHLLRHLPGHAVLIWDGGKIHKSEEVKDFLGRTKRLHVHPFPGYAPTLNPIEQAWTHGKRDLSSSVHEGLDTLAPHLRSSLSRVRNSQQLLRSCIEHSELPWP